MSIQIPNLHTSNNTRVSVERAKVIITERQDAAHTGEFIVNGNLRFLAADDYPAGAMTIRVNLSDSAQGVVVIKTVEQLDTMGKHSPTVFATGRCNLDADTRAVGCRYWLMIAHNRPKTVDDTPDIISFLIYDRNGKRVAYGTGPVVKPGLVSVAPGE